MREADSHSTCCHLRCRPAWQHHKSPIRGEEPEMVTSKYTHKHTHTHLLHYPELMWRQNIYGGFQLMRESEFRLSSHTNGTHFGKMDKQQIRPQWAERNPNPVCLWEEDAAAETPLGSWAIGRTWRAGASEGGGKKYRNCRRSLGKTDTFGSLGEHWRAAVKNNLTPPRDKVCSQLKTTAL